MSRSRPPLSPEVDALLDRERVVPPLPSRVRARAVTRAQAALIAGRVSSPLELGAAPRTRWRVATALACAASVAAAAAAYEIGAHRRSLAGSSLPTPATHVVSPAVPLPSPAAPTAPSTAAPPETIDAAPTPSSAAATTSATRALRDAPGPEELRLLGLARAAVARHDFAAALVPIGEHARRFKDGRLAEEREALRVKALSGLGRTGEARRAANAFEARFPRSVLLPAVSHMGTGR
jgi:hypothetical protein